MNDKPQENGISPKSLDNIYATMDQLFAESMANRIICMRIWGYFTKAAAEAEGVRIEDYVQKQRLESLQSVDLWNFSSHKDEIGLKKKIKNAINIAFNGLIQGPDSKAGIQ